MKRLKKLCLIYQTLAGFVLALLMLVGFQNPASAQVVEERSDAVELEESRRALPFMTGILFNPESIKSITQIDGSQKTSSVFYLIQKGEDTRTLIRADSKSGAVLGVYEQQLQPNLDAAGNLETRWSGTGFWVPGKLAQDPWRRYELDQSEVLSEFFKDFPRGSVTQQKLSVENFQKLPVYESLFSAVVRLKQVTRPYSFEFKNPAPFGSGVEAPGPLKGDGHDQKGSSSRYPLKDLLKP